MPRIYELPTGEQVEFPDDVSDADAKAYLDKNYWSPTAANNPGSFFGALIRAESGGDPAAYNETDDPSNPAIGLLQVRKNTALNPGYGVTPVSSEEDLYDPQANFRFGSEYMSKLLARYNGDRRTALMAWHMGPGRTDKFLEGDKTKAPGPETSKFVHRVLSDSAEAAPRPLQDKQQAVVAKEGGFLDTAALSFKQAAATGSEGLAVFAEQLGYSEFADTMREAAAEYRQIAQEHVREKGGVPTFSDYLDDQTSFLNWVAKGPIASQSANHMASLSLGLLGARLGALALPAAAGGPLAWAVIGGSAIATTLPYFSLLGAGESAETLRDAGLKAEDKVPLRSMAKELLPSLSPEALEYIPEEVDPVDFNTTFGVALGALEVGIGVDAAIRRLGTSLAGKKWLKGTLTESLKSGVAGRIVSGGRELGITATGEGLQEGLSYALQRGVEVSLTGEKFDTEKARREMLDSVALGFAGGTTMGGGIIVAQGLLADEDGNPNVQDGKFKAVPVPPSLAGKNVRVKNEAGEWVTSKIVAGAVRDGEPFVVMEDGTVVSLDTLKASSEEFGAPDPVPDQERDIATDAVEVTGETNIPEMPEQLDLFPDLPDVQAPPVNAPRPEDNVQPDSGEQLDLFLAPKDETTIRGRPQGEGEVAQASLKLHRRSHAAWRDRLFEHMERAPRKSATGEQWLSYIKKAGLRKSLLDWYNLDLSIDPKRQYSREHMKQVIDWATPFHVAYHDLRPNPLLDQTTTEFEANSRALNSLSERFGPGPVEMWPPNGQREFRILMRERNELTTIHDRIMEENTEGVAPSEFQKHTVPGGTNYREMFLTAQGMASPSPSENVPEWKDGHTEYNNIKNPIVRLRMKDRDRVLSIEEIQSPRKSSRRKMPQHLRDTWLQWGTRLALLEAINGDYDAIAIPTGKQQRDIYGGSRYDYRDPKLSVNVVTNSGLLEGVLSWTNANGPQSSLLKDSRDISAFQDFESIIFALEKRFGPQMVDALRNARVEESPNSIIYDMKGRIIQAQSQEKLGTLYDRTIPDTFEKLFRSFGHDVKGRLRDVGDGQQMVVFDLSPELKTAVGMQNVPIPSMRKDAVKDLPQIEKGLRRILSEVAPSAKLKFDYNLIRPGVGDEVAGYNLGNIIAVALDQSWERAMETGFHETWHWLERNGFVDPTELDVVNAHMSELRERARELMQEDGYPPALIEKYLADPQEVRAVIAGSYLKGQFQKRENLLEKIPRPVRPVFKKLYELMRRFRNWLQKLGYTKPEHIFDMALTNQFIERGPVATAAYYDKNTVTAEAVAQNVTEMVGGTKAKFNNWFDGSKVVTDSGLPQPNFIPFMPGTGPGDWAAQSKVGDDYYGGGFLASPDYRTADDMVQQYHKQHLVQMAPVLLSIKNPVFGDQPMSEELRAKAIEYLKADKTVGQSPYMSGKIYDELRKAKTPDELMMDGMIESKRLFQKAARKLGYDGIHAAEENVWIAFYPDQILGLASPSIRAFQGTDSRPFYNFANESLGTGQGASNYGYGHYFSSKTEIANRYKGRTGTGPGRTVEVELAPEEYQLLVWEDTLSNQSQFVKDALTQLMAKFPGDEFDGFEGAFPYMRGGDLYQHLASVLGKDGMMSETSKQMASQMLQEVGIRGNKFADPRHEGAHNYVIFDPADINIVDQHYFDSPEAQARLRFPRRREDRPTLHEMPGQFATIKDITAAGSWLQSPRMIADRHVLFTPIYQIGLQFRNKQTEITSKAGEMLAPYGRLSNPDAMKLAPLLEMERQMQRIVEPNENGELIIVNEYGDTDLSQRGEVIRIDDPVLVAAHQAVRDTGTYLWDQLRLAYLVDLADFVLPRADSFKLLDNPDADAAGQIDHRVVNAKIQAIKQQYEPMMDSLTDSEKGVLENTLDRLKRVSQHLRDAERMREEYVYTPFYRFGDWGMAIEGDMLDEDGAPLVDETTGERVRGEIHFETFESQITPKGRRINKAKALARREELLARYADQNPTVKSFEYKDPATGVVERNEFWPMTPDEIKKRATGNPLATIDLLMSQLASNNQATWDSLRGALEEIIKAQGFAAHLKRARLVPGYSTDFKRAWGNYIVGAAGFASRQMYASSLDRAVGAVPPGRNRKLWQTADQYRRYLLDPTEEWARVRALAYTFFLGGNVSSALIQLMNLPMYSAPSLSQFTSYPKALKYLIQSGTQTANMMRKTFQKLMKARIGEVYDVVPDPTVWLDPLDPRIGRFRNEDERQAVIKAWEEGVLKPRLMIQQFGLTPVKSMAAPLGFAKWWDQAQIWLASMFGTMETAARMAHFLAAYRLAKDDPRVLERANKVRGQSHLWNAETGGNPTAYQFAEFEIDDVMGQFDKVNRARYQRRAGAMIFQFQTWPHQILENTFKMTMMRGGPGKKAAMLVAAWLLFTSGTDGMPGGEDMRRMIEGAWKSATGEDLDLNKEIQKMAVNDLGLSEVAANSITGGYLRHLIPADMSKRVGLGRLPGSNLLSAWFGDGEISELLGPIGSVTSGGPLAALQRYQSGEGIEATREMLPTFLKNAYDSVFTWGSKGYITRRGARILGPEDLDITDKIVKGIGFMPSKAAVAREKQYAQKRAGDPVSGVSMAFKRQIVSALLEQREANARGDVKTANRAAQEVREIFSEIRQYNSGQPAHKRVILNPRSIFEEVLMQINPRYRAFRRSRKISRPEVLEIDKLYPRIK